MRWSHILSVPRNHSGFPNTSAALGFKMSARRSPSIPLLAQRPLNLFPSVTNMSENGDPIEAIQHQSSEPLHTCTVSDERLHSPPKKRKYVDPECESENPKIQKHTSESHDMSVTTHQACVEAENSSTRTPCPGRRVRGKGSGNAMNAGRLTVLEPNKNEVEQEMAINCHSSVVTNLLKSNMKGSPFEAYFKSVVPDDSPPSTINAQTVTVSAEIAPSSAPSVQTKRCGRPPGIISTYLIELDTVKKKQHGSGYKYIYYKCKRCDGELVGKNKSRPRDHFLFYCPIFSSTKSESSLQT